MWGYFKMKLIFSLNDINMGTDKYFLSKKGLRIKYNIFKMTIFLSSSKKKYTYAAQEFLFLNKSKPDDKKNIPDYFLLVLANAFFSKIRSYIL